MRYGLQTHFDGLVDGATLTQVRAFGFTCARLDGQASSPALIGQMAADAQAAGLAPLVIVADIVRLRAVPLHADVEWTNEPDGDISPADYRRGLDEACAVARERGIRLWAPAISNLDQDSLDWLNAVRDAGGGWPEGMHGVSVHRYSPDGQFASAHRGFSSREAEVKWLRAACAGLPYIVTETGYPTYDITEDEAAARIAQEWGFWLAQGAEAVYLFQINDGLGREEHYGIRRVDGTWKPSAFTVPGGQPSEPPPDGGNGWEGRTKIALKAANGLYVCAEEGGDDTGTVRANRQDAGAWETFAVHVVEGGIALETINGRFLCAEEGGGGDLHANREAVGPWETFRVVGRLTEGASIALVAHDGTHYVCAEVGSADPIVNATRTAQGAWETFVVRVLEGGLPARREGLVVTDGCAVRDGTGPFYPLGVTFFWGLYGWKFERARVEAHLDWLATYGVDYLRILGEVDWPGRSIDPAWPDYEQVLAGFADAAWARGLRLQVTVIGGKPKDPRGLARKVTAALKGREVQVLTYEAANEWDRLSKVSFADLERVAKQIAGDVPNLVGLSRPRESDDGSTLAEMRTATGRCGGDMLPLHTRRKEHDYRWAQVRQGYDFDKVSPYVGSHNEPPGPQSSVGDNDSPLQLAMMRVLGIMCGAPLYVLHVAQGVTGQADPNHGRPENMWEVPNVDAILRAVRAADAPLPDGLPNWKVVNNGRSEHPLPLDPRLGVGFWEGNGSGCVNKNYAAVSGNRFAVALCGVKAPSSSGAQVQPQLVGTARRACRVTAYDPVTGTEVDARGLSAGEKWMLPGRVDTMAGYVVLGEYL